MTTPNKDRADFEAIGRSYGNNLSQINGVYLNDDTAAAWQGYQASCANKNEKLAELEGAYGALAVEYDYLKDKLTAPPSEKEIEEVAIAINLQLPPDLLLTNDVAKAAITKFQEMRR